MKLVTVGLVLTFFAQVAFSHTPPQTRKPRKKSDAVKRDPSFSFTGKLVLEGKVVRGSIRKSEIDSLLARRVELSGAPSNAQYGLGFPFAEGWFPVFSCQEWLQARAQGLSAELNTSERAAESFFVHTCSFLSALKAANPARRSYIAKPQVGLSSNNSTTLSAGIDLKSGQLTKVRITRQAYGDDWPFDVDEGELACANAGSVAVFFIANGKTYSLNAWARQSKIDGQPISTDAFTEVVNYSNSSAIFNKAFAMCQTKGAM